MTKVDRFSAIERGMAAAQDEKTKPSLKAVGPGGAGGDLYRNTNNFNVLQDACPCPTTEILVGPDGEAERPLTKQAVTLCGPTCPNCPTTFDNPVEISRTALGNPAPRIVRGPPFGSDGVPARYTSAWEALLAQCPPSVATVVWEAAIYDSADLFGFWGAELDRLRWPAGSLFDVPDGLVWFLKGQHVLALGAECAFTQSGRVFDQKRQ